MKVIHATITLDGTSMTGTATLTQIMAFDCQHMKGLSVYLKWSGTPNGTFKLQKSNNWGKFKANADWKDIASATLSVSGSAGGDFIEVKDLYCGWVRVVYTNTSGTGTYLTDSSYVVAKEL